MLSEKQLPQLIYECSNKLFSNVIIFISLTRLCGEFILIQFVNHRWHKNAALKNCVMFSSKRKSFLYIIYDAWHFVCCDGNEIHLKH